MTGIGILIVGDGCAITGRLPWGQGSKTYTNDLHMLTGRLSCLPRRLPEKRPGNGASD